MAVSAKDVGWVYRMILNRAPTPEERARHLAMADLDIAALRKALLATDEARAALDVREDPLVEFGRRKQRALEFVTKEQSGIEIGPWFNPLCPPSAGYRCMSADVFDYETQVRRATERKVAPVLVKLIAPVDFVGSASELDLLVGAKGLLGTFDYIISSHNLEHIPDPVTFLQACQRVLKPGGTVSMILPDCRASGDYFRAPSTTGEMLEAWWHKRTHPSPAQIFSFVARTGANAGQAEQWRWQVDDERPTLRLMSSLDEAYKIAGDHAAGTLPDYFDAHCWVFTPASLRLIIEELHALRLIGFSVRKIVSTGGGEFFVHLVVDPEAPMVRADTRLARMHEVNRETAVRS